PGHQRRPERDRCDRQEGGHDQRHPGPAAGHASAGGLWEPDAGPPPHGPSPRGLIRPPVDLTLIPDHPIRQPCRIFYWRRATRLGNFAATVIKLTGWLLVPPAPPAHAENSLMEQTTAEKRALPSSAGSRSKTVTKTAPVE